MDVPARPSPWTDERPSTSWPRTSRLRSPSSTSPPASSSSTCCARSGSTRWASASSSRTSSRRARWPAWSARSSRRRRSSWAATVPRSKGSRRQLIDCDHVVKGEGIRRRGDTWAKTSAPPSITPPSSPPRKRIVGVPLQTDAAVLIPGVGCPNVPLLRHQPLLRPDLHPVLRHRQGAVRHLQRGRARDRLHRSSSSWTRTSSSGRSARASCSA